MSRYEKVAAGNQISIKRGCAYPSDSRSPQDKHKKYDRDQEKIEVEVVLEELKVMECCLVLGVYRSDVLRCFPAE